MIDHLLYLLCLRGLRASKQQARKQVGKYLLTYLHT